MDQIHIKTWKVSQLDGSTIRVATIEQGPRNSSPLCKGCPAPCCRGLYCVPVLNGEEFIHRKFEFHYISLPQDLVDQKVKADYLAVLGKENGPCPYFDSDKWRCKVWPNCPASCKAYDCREDPRPEIKEFVKQWSNEKDKKSVRKLWQEQLKQT